MKKYESEKFTYVDKQTGAEVTRLTSLRTNSNHLYFTNNCFFDGGRSLVFSSDRSGVPNLYTLELQSGEIEQITDLPDPGYPNGNGLQLTFVHDETATAVFFCGRRLFAIDVRSKVSRVIYEVPTGYNNHIVSIGADGKYAYTSVFEDVSARRKEATLQGTFDCHPHSMIMKIAIDGSGAECIFEENNFIAHANASPTDPDKLTFCHEGFWDKVDHRLWAMDIAERRVWKLHPCAEREAIGHEYWFADGKRLGYHGVRECWRDGLTDEDLHGRVQLGAVNFDGTEDRSYEFPFHTGHIFSTDESLIVGDGDRRGMYLRLWSLGEDGYEQPRALCKHRSSFKSQECHVHPRITPDKKYVLYTSDESGYNQLYLVKIPDDINALPLLSDVWEC